MTACFTVQLRACLLACALLLSVAPAPAADADAAACRKNLAAIAVAVKAYRADFKDLPPWLSDLVPKYLKDPNLLVCPVIRRTGAVKTFGIEDPNLSTAYTYEFSEGTIPDQIFKGANRTMKEWKRRQMSLVGSKVPMVRCHHHEKVLNILFDGQLTEGEASWEAELASEIDPAELSPGRIFSVEAARLAAAKAQADIPPRDPSTSPKLLDLSRFYNAALTEGWHRNAPNEPVANDLSWLPRGIQKFGGVEFDVRGLVQIASRKLNHPRFVHGVRNLRVDQKASKLHVLHSTGWSAGDGTPVAILSVKMASGEKHEFVIRYADHLYDWVAQGAQLKDPKSSALVWTGRSPATDSQTPLHIYKTEWVNPTPDKTIASIDYVGANEDPAPFLIAVTAE